jgi:hypothetical protein
MIVSCVVHVREYFVTRKWCADGGNFEIIFFEGLPGKRNKNNGVMKPQTGKQKIKIKMHNPNKENCSHNSKLKTLIFALYDTGTIKGYERPCGGFEEVSLTLRTANPK